MEKNYASFFRGRKCKKRAARLAGLLLFAFLAGCGKPLEADCNTVYIQKDGEVVSLAVEKLDKDYYDEEELKSYVEEKISAYQAENGEDTVEIDEFSVEDGTAKLRIDYDGYESYQKVNGVTLFSGTIPQALAEGYDFDAEFTEIKDGAAAGTVDKKSIVEMDDKVVILSEKVDVKVDGEVLYMSSEYTALKDEDTVSIQLPEDAEDGESQSLAYIIYQ